MGMLRDEVIKNLKNLKLDSISEVVQFAGDTFDDVSHIVHNAIENEDIPGEKIILKEGKKIVNKASSIGVGVIHHHKDKFPKEIKPLTDTVEIILESMVDITTNKEDIIDGTVTTAPKAEEAEKSVSVPSSDEQPVKAKTAVKPKRKYKRRSVAAQKVTAETNGPSAPKKRGRPRKNKPVANSALADEDSSST